MWWFGRSRQGDEPRVTGFDLAFRRGPADGRDLVVAFSSGRKFAFYRHDFGRDVLFVADPKLRYYLRNAGGLARAILAIVDREDYQRVLFVGSSKGGFGALSIARLCARLRPSSAFHVVAFSPQVQLFPYNPKLYFSSYRDLNRHAARSEGLTKTLRRLGDVSDVGAIPNLVLELIYARGAALDRDEAHRISGPNVRHRTVAGATHGTAFHFMCHGLNRSQIRARVRQAYRRDGDMDLRQTRPRDERALVEQIAKSAAREPSINELVGAVLGRTVAAPLEAPSRLSGVARKVAAWFAGSVSKIRRGGPGQILT